MKQERKIEGNERHLVELATTQAAINEHLGRTAALQERMNGLRAQAEAEGLRAEVMRARAQALVAAKEEILALLEVASDAKDFTTDWDRGVYSWEEEEKKEKTPRE